MTIKYIEFKNRVREWADKDNREAGFSVETAIIVGALVALALALVLLLQNVFDTHTADL